MGWDMEFASVVPHILKLAPESLKCRMEEHRGKVGFLGLGTGLTLVSVCVLFLLLHMAFPMYVARLAL